MICQGHNNSNERGFLSLVEESEWLSLLQSVMQLAGAVTDLIDLQGSSVILALEDGWDLTAQVSSLAQLCLDPYYRTIQVRSEQVGERVECKNLQSKRLGGGGVIILKKATFLDTIYLNSSFLKCLEN